MKRLTHKLTKMQRKTRSARKTWTHAVKKVKQAKTRGTDLLMKNFAKSLKKINDQVEAEHTHDNQCDHDHDNPIAELIDVPVEVEPVNNPI
jgi:hypothetical protein